MNIFCGCELAFNNTYFSAQRRAFKVKTDAPVQSLLALSEVPQSAGSFAFPDDDLGLQNRVITWRADGSNLYLDEFSAKRDLIDSSIAINFPQSFIVPGTNIFLCKGVLVLAVPTQSGIHSFWLQLINSVDPNRHLTINKSVFGLLHSNEELLVIHDFYAFKNAAVALKAHILLTKYSGTLISVVCTTESQLICVTLPQFQGNGQGEWEETLLNGNTVFGRFFKGKGANTCDSVIINGVNEEPLIYSVHRDGVIRCWNYHTKSVKFFVNVNEFLGERVNSQIATISIKPSGFVRNKKHFLTLKIVAGEFTRFVLLKQQEKTLDICFACELDTKFVFDYICTISDPLTDEFCFWAIVNESCYAGDERDTFVQPYTLKRCSFSLSINSDSAWDNVQPAALDSKLDSSLFNFPEIEAIRNRIFDGNNYSFSVVNRAIQVTCKQQQKQFEFNNWTALSNSVDEYLSSGMFKTYLNFEDGSLLLNFNTKSESKLKVAISKFWQSLLTCCNQLQEDDLKPLGFFYSANLGLLGVVQSCRFTVYLPPDEHMRVICEPNNKVVKSFFRIIEQFLRVDTDEALGKINVNETLETITTYACELCRIIRAFAEHRPFDVTNKLKDSNSEYLGSSFSTGYLAAALRRWIIGRLRFADIISTLISTIPKILAISTEARTNPRLDLVISAHNSTISQIIQYYTVMWISLSVRLINKSPNDRISKQMSVAQAFFKYGSSSLIKRLPNVSSSIYRRLEDDDEDEQEYEHIDDEELDVSGQPPPSRWSKKSFCDDESVALNPLYQSMNVSPGEVSFTKFFRETLAGSIISLWPESTTLTLPLFLAENGFYDALKSYCTLLSEPFISELAFALRFFQGIAFSGLGDPATAWKFFQDVSVGIVSQDNTLNVLLLNINNERERAGKAYSLAEYYNKVMLIFKSHNYSSYVIQAGDKAVASTTKEDGVLANVFATLFAQNLHAKNYVEAVRIMLFNPDVKFQSTYLRQLLSHLLDNGEIRILVNLSYEHLTESVGNILETRCHNETILSAIESSYEIVFAFYTVRFDFDKAAKILYDFARRLAREVQSRELLEKRCKVLATVFQSLKVADPGKDVVYCEVEKDEREDQFALSEFKEVELASTNQEHVNLCLGVGESGKEREITKMRFVALSREDIGRELIKVEARLQLIDDNPMAIPPLQSNDILRELIKHKKYDLAWVIANEFALPFYDLLEVVTKEALMTDKSQMFVNDNCEPLWTDSNRQFMSDSVGSFKTHWRIVISYLDLALNRSPSDSIALKVVAYTFLKYSVKIPDWLFIRYKKVNFNDFIRTLIDFNELSDAFQYLLPEIDSAILKVTAGNLDLLLPFTHIDELFRLSKTVDEKNLPIEEMKQKLKRLFTCYEIAQRGTQLIR